MPEGFNYIDIVVLAGLSFGIFKGLKNGLIKEIAAIVGLILGIWAGFRFAFIFADYYRESFEIPENLIPFLGFLTAFILVLLGVIFAGRLLRETLKKANLSTVDKAAGATFGALKWGLILGTLLVLVGKAKVLPEEHTKGSFMYPLLTQYVEGVQEYSVALIPAAKNVFTEIDTYFQDLETIREKKEAVEQLQQ